MLTWLKATVREAARLFVRFVPWLLLATVPFALLRIRAGHIEAPGGRELLWMALILLCACALGCFVFAALGRLQGSTFRYYLRWMLAASFAVTVVWAVATGVDWYLGERREFMGNPLVWLYVVTLGAFTGAGYGWVVRRLRGSTEQDAPRPGQERDPPG